MASSSQQPPEEPETITFPSSTTRLIPSLPDDLALEILTRLPVQSIIKFTTVSKLWNFVIHSPYFTKSQLSTSTYPQQYLLHYSVTPCTVPKDFTFYRTPLHSVLHDPVIVPQTITHSMYLQSSYLTLVGSINGIVCLSIDSLHGTNLVFWNPSLRKHKKIPLISCKTNSTYHYGFGYDAVSDDYKLAAIMWDFNEKSLMIENTVMVYSRKSDSWKTIEGFKEPAVVNSDVGHFVNGKVHFAAKTSGRKWNIMSIDFGDESFGELDQPDYGRSSYNDGLGVIGECICVLYNDGRSPADFWVMKEYGVRESWTKIASVQYSFGYKTLGYNPPLCLRNNGNMLWMFAPKFREELKPTKVVVYNTQDESRSFITIPHLYGYIVYVESLVLP